MLRKVKNVNIVQFFIGFKFTWGNQCKCAYIIIDIPNMAGTFFRTPCIYIYLAPKFWNSDSVAEALEEIDEYFRSETFVDCKNRSEILREKIWPSKDISPEKKLSQKGQKTMQPRQFLPEKVSDLEVLMLLVYKNIIPSLLLKLCVVDWSLNKITTPSYTILLLISLL